MSPYERRLPIGILALAAILLLNISNARAQSGVCKPVNRPELTPQAAYDSLVAGNRRFMTGTMLPRSMPCSRDSTKEDQRPLAVVLNCMDSRVAPEFTFDRGIGEIFSIRVAGNVVNEDVLGSLEYAVVKVNVKVIAVVGHTDCGAVKGAIDAYYKLTNLTSLLVKIQPAISAVDSTIKPRSSANPIYVNAVTAVNVVYVMDQLLKRSPALKDAVESKRVKLVGGIQSVDNGAVAFQWEYKP